MLRMFSYIVSDTFTEGKYGPDFPDRNDDTLYDGTHFKSVFDGVSGPQGAAAAICAAEVLSTLPATATERDYAHAVTQEMQRRFGQPTTNTRMAATTGVILSVDRQEIWFYGDARAALIGEETFQILERTQGFEWQKHTDQTRVLLNTLMLNSGEISADSLYEHDPGRELLNAIHCRQHHLANTPGGYTVLCAKPVPDDMAMVHSFDPNQLDAIVLMSDGYPVHLMDKSDFWSHVSAEEALAKVNAEDPHCLTINPGPKGLVRNPETGRLNASYDDRSYMKILLF